MKSLEVKEGLEHVLQDCYDYFKTNPQLTTQDKRAILVNTLTSYCLDRSKQACFEQKDLIIDDVLNKTDISVNSKVVFIIKDTDSPIKYN